MGQNGDVLVTLAIKKIQLSHKDIISPPLLILSHFCDAQMCSITDLLSVHPG